MAASPKLLLEWSRVTCASYRGVDIKNMSTSFRDGLAFCAIIHRHRPDLIDFTSLSKDEVYENNKLAFEVAETKLGVPALLHPNDMASTEVPDCLGVITYLSQYYYFFSGRACASPAKLRSSHVFHSLTRSKTSDALKRLKSLPDVEAGEEDQFPSVRPPSVCNVCHQIVHLIQRRLVDGKVFHRSCFRCTLCHSSLLPESYSQGQEAGSLICTFHIAGSSGTRVILPQQAEPADTKPEAGYCSLDGSAVGSVPHYTENTEPQARPVSRRSETGGAGRPEQGGGRGGSSVGPPPPPPPQPRVADGTVDNAAESFELPSGVTQERKRPVPAPRRPVEASGGPVPAPRLRASPSMSSLTPAGGSPGPRRSPPTSSHLQTTSRPKVLSSHPWMSIVHPGPWTQLPPAPPPIPHPRSKAFLSRRARWSQPKTPPPNPFDEEEEGEGEEGGDSDSPGGTVAPQSADRTESPGSAVRSDNAVISAGDDTNPPRQCEEEEPESTEVPGPVKEDRAVETSRQPRGSSSETDLSDASAAGSSSASAAAESHILPRSLSVPAITSDCAHGQSATSCHNKSVCKENPFDRKPAMTKSKTLQELPASRGRAPGHGFPLVRRKVQTDRCVSIEALEVEMSELNKRLEALEQRGLDLERNLRECTSDKEEEARMLLEWFSLVHERHALSRRDTELVYQRKQQKLEDRQADVEYELRCLLNKPESDWTQQDRGREQQLMDELVAIIEQRNQIVSSLEQDRQRERKEDVLLDDEMKNKALQKERRKELKKSKGKFKPTKVFKLLTQKSESIKESTDKKS